MSATTETLSECVGQAAVNELDASFRKIQHCLEQLSDEQLWWRPAAEMNSIANLLLHLAGNVRQWIIAGVGGQPDVRERQKEFDERGPIPKTELLARLANVVAEAQQVLANVTAAELVRPRRIQGFHCTGAQAIFHSVAHFQGHAQEIVHLTRRQLGDGYRFDFVPEGGEQDATE